MNSQSPNTLNLNSYTQPDDNLSTNEQNYTQNHNTNTTIEQKYDNFANRILQQEELMTKMAKEITDINNSKHFITDFYPNYVLDCQYKNDEEKKIVAYNNEQLNKALISLQKVNSTLKEEIKGYHFEFAKKTRLTEALISQNKIMRYYVSKKNKQIQQLITKIVSTQDVQLTRLQQTLDELNQENGILSEHYKQMKQKLKQKNEEQLQISKAIDDQNSRRVHLMAKLKELQDEEQHMSKNNIMNSENQKQAIQRENYLLAERERLLKLKKQYELDHFQINEQLSKYKQDNHSNKLKSDIQRYQLSQTNPEIQFETASQKHERYLRQNNQLQQQIQANSNKITQYSVMNRKLERKLKEYQQQERKLQQQRREANDIQTTLMSQIQVLNIQWPILQKKLYEDRNKTQEFISKNIQKFQQIQRLAHKQILKANQQSVSAIKSANKKQHEDRQAIQAHNIEIARLQQSLKEGHTYLQALHQQYQENKQKQQIVVQLRQNLSMIRSQQQQQQRRQR